MKSRLFLCCIFTIVAVLSALKSEANDSKAFKTPEKIIQKFDSIFPGASGVDWSRKRATYTANFTYHNKVIAITFNREADIIGSLEEIDIDSLPDKSKRKLIKDYSTFKKVIVLRRFKRARPEYDVEVMKGEQHYILNFNKNGMLMHEYDVEKNDLESFTSY